jgi:hypothetical protein
MKVYISNYRNHWLSPYTILEKVIFWREIDYDEPLIEKWSDILKPFCEFRMSVLNFLFPRINYVKIDRWDTWSMDSTLATIILPMLKQLKRDQHGGPGVDDEDVPEEIKSTSAPPKKDEWDLDDNHFKRWDWVMDELIWTFEQLHPDFDYEQQYYSGKVDTFFEPSSVDENGKATMYEMKRGHNDTFKVDMIGLKAHNERIANGMRLFGKYYRGLWD